MVDSQEHFDVVVIGSGAGGAPIAHTMARSKKSVLVIDKGPFFPSASRRSNGAQ